MALYWGLEHCILELHLHWYLAGAFLMASSPWMHLWTWFNAWPIIVWIGGDTLVLSWRFEHCALLTNFLHWYVSLRPAVACGGRCTPPWTFFEADNWRRPLDAVIHVALSWRPAVRASLCLTHVNCWWWKCRRWEMDPECIGVSVSQVSAIPPPHYYLTLINSAVQLFFG